MKKLHYKPGSPDEIGRLFIPIGEWNSPGNIKPPLYYSELPQWHKDLLIARHDLLMKTPYTQLLDFESVMDEMEKRYGI